MLDFRTFLLNAGFVLTLAVPVAAQTRSFSRLPSGTEYQLYRRNAAGRFEPRQLVVPTDAPYAARTGQLLTVFMDYRTGRDSLLMSTHRLSPVPQPMALPAAPPRGSVEEAVALLLPGDSAAFRFNADTVFARSFHQPVPPFLKKAGNVLTVNLRAYELISADELKARQQKVQAEMQAQASTKATQLQAQENAQILAYAKANKLTVKKTAGGVYYAITKAGKGLPPKKGQTVAVLYRGTLLATGAEFDASAKHGNIPFEFALGQGNVIKGWDEGIAMLNKGSKAALLIPSGLGYGARGAGSGIPPNAVLRFDVELVDVKPDPKPEVPPAAKQLLK